MRYEFGGLTALGGLEWLIFGILRYVNVDGECNASSRVSFSLPSLRKMKTTRSLGLRAPHKVMIHALD